MHRRSLVAAVALAACAALGVFSSSALAELTENESFEYNSPGMTFEAQHVGPAHCLGKYQVNPVRFPQIIQEETGYPEGGREVVTCRAPNHQQLETNIAPGHAFPELNPAADYWVSEWFRSFNPGPKCFTITLPRDRAKGRIFNNGRGYHVVAYFEYTRECH
jgi:hypothetical protein